MKAKILIVEDEGILAMGLKRKLDKLGYEIIGLALLDKKPSIWRVLINLTLF